MVSEQERPAEPVTALKIGEQLRPFIDGFERMAESGLRGARRVTAVLGQSRRPGQVGVEDGS